MSLIAAPALSTIAAWAAIVAVPVALVVYWFGIRVRAKVSAQMDQAGAVLVRVIKRGIPALQVTKVRLGVPATRGDIEEVPALFSHSLPTDVTGRKAICDIYLQIKGDSAESRTDLRALVWLGRKKAKEIVPKSFEGYFELPKMRRD